MFEPKYTITNRLLTVIGKIESYRAIIENSPLIPLWERQFREDAVLRSVHHSTHVEGNNLSKEEAKRVLDGKQIYADKRDVQDVINYREVLSYIERMYMDITKPITEETVLDLHRILMKDLCDETDLGTYRRVPVVVKNNISGEVIMTPPSPEEVEKLMKEFLQWLWQTGREDISPIIKAGVIHYQMSAIHPFVDGNGRTARSLSTLSLYREGYDIKRFFCLDEYFDQDTVSYYSALKNTDLTGNMSGWLEYFAEGLESELKRINQRVLQLSRDARLRKVLGQVPVNERQEKILLFMERYRKCANKDWITLFPNVSEDTILRDLNYLIKHRLVRKKGKTKASYYELR